MSLASKLAHGIHSLSLAIIAELFKPPAPKRAPYHRYATWQEYRLKNPARFYRAKIQRVHADYAEPSDSVRVDNVASALVVTVEGLSNAIPLRASDGPGEASDMALQAALDRFTLALNGRGVYAHWFVISNQAAFELAVRSA